MLRSALLTASLALAALATGTAPAHAAPVTTFSGSDCPAGRLCLFRDYDFSGGGIALSSRTELYSLANYGFNDQLSSWSNNSGVTCMWWNNGLDSGGGHEMRNGYRVNLLPSENDTASSVRCDFF
ncbi:peptidase inhibitor family I36 protein [Streptomyces sp. NPDC093252]|uniref:peptidase inhibitor family I36 protein n=1 Tax=Streptomyces sp. NPDC093252 TaxID=3154980 RepID=UPI00343DCDBB